MAEPALAARASPVRVSLIDLIRQKAGGESIKIAAPRIRAIAAGGHLSPFKGRGVEFDESRPYQAGDDLRTIDWRVTARTGKPHTKVFREERNRPVILWLDLRKTMMFATKGAYKAVAAAEAAALVAWSAVANGDRLGGLVFSDAEHHELRPRLGRRAALRLFQLVCDSSGWREDEKAATDGASAIDNALVRLERVARPGSVVFLFSDFRGLGSDSERHLKQLSGHCDLFIVHVYDPIEAELPPPGRYRVQVGARSIAIETGDARMREQYQAQFEARRQRVEALRRFPGVTVVELKTNDDAYRVLGRVFRTL
jgi:uncharacterized protein (DUF58 family)